MLEKIKQQYDAEHDHGANALIPWYVMELVRVIEAQEKTIEALRNQVDQLDSRLHEMEK